MAQQRMGVVGLGDMGSGLAKNLLAAGFEVTGFDLDPDRMVALEAIGGQPANAAAGVGAASDVVFVMVMNGDQARSVIFEDGLLATMSPGGAILMTATIRAAEMRQIAADLANSGLDVVDSPVSGGFAGAQGGTLTMMAAGSDAALENCRPAMAAVGGTIHRVGTEPGQGQTVKACLQSLIGSIYAATFEASVLAAKAGVGAEALHGVISTSSAGCESSSNGLRQIIDGKFEKTGSHISTMHKDLTIALDLAREMGVPLFTASTAMQLFQAGITKHPDGDNWVVTRILEDIVGAKLRRG